MPPDTTGLWSETTDSAVLHARMCSSCGHMLFPPQLYGCPACGALADRLTPVTLPAAGRLHSFAVVNLHQVYQTPYTIAEVELDAGPIVRSLFDPAVEPVIGGHVVGHGADTDGGRDLVFTNAEER